jgi:hypothetical protein
MRTRLKPQTPQKVTFNKPLPPLTSPDKLKKIRDSISGIRTLLDARRVTGLSNREMGIAMAAATGRVNARNEVRHYAPSTIARMCHPRAKWSMPMKRAHLDAVARVLDEWVKETAGSGRVRFQLLVNSPWHCWIEVQCGCGHWEKFDLRRTSFARCKECARQ